MDIGQMRGVVQQLEAAGHAASGRLQNVTMSQAAGEDEVTEQGLARSTRRNAIPLISYLTRRIHRGGDPSALRQDQILGKNREEDANPEPIARLGAPRQLLKSDFGGLLFALNMSRLGCF
jgi:hypothetical protein